MKRIQIFTDGASRGNPGPGGWGSIIIFSSGKIMTMNEELRIKNNEREVLQVKEIGGKEKNTTNNRMELAAVIESLNFASKLKARPTGSSGRAKSSKLTVRIYTDSSYVLRGAKDWVHAWQKNNWKTKTKKPVLNQDLWKKFIKISSDFKTEWRLLKGHSGIPANERCDEVATIFADGRKPKLYSGILKNYRIDLSVPAEQEKPKNKKSKKVGGGAYSYVSLVGGIIKTHKTWAECEKRVKGKSGAKFKKSYSLGDEENIKSLWRQGSLL